MCGFLKALEVDSVVGYLRHDGRTLAKRCSLHLGDVGKLALTYLGLSSAHDLSSVHRLGLLTLLECSYLAVRTSRVYDLMGKRVRLVTAIDVGRL